jgi:twitching motility protein PilT
VFDRLVDPDETDSIIDVMTEGGFYGMQTFDQHLVELVKERLVSLEDARHVATHPHDFELALHGTMDRGVAFKDEERTAGLPF